MKTTKKALLFTFCAVLLVVASILGTMAYLSASDTVINTFTVGNVKIKLDEAAVDENGELVTPETRVDGNEYNLIPGHIYHKDPTVTVLKGSEESYVRMIVTINKQKDLDAIFASEGGKSLETFFGNISPDWNLVKETENADDTRSYEFRYKETVSAKSNDVVLDDLFETITVPGDITNDQLSTIAGLEIKVVAHAMQADGFEDANEAWTAFDEQVKKAAN